jgi:hypothetical protein
MALQPLWTLAVFFQFLNIYTAGSSPWAGDQPVARPLPTHRTTQTHNKRTQISMTRVRFVPTIPMFERGKTVHALDHAAPWSTICMSTETKYTCMHKKIKTHKWTGLLIHLSPDYLRLSCSYIVHLVGVSTLLNMDQTPSVISDYSKIMNYSSCIVV